MHRREYLVAITTVGIGGLAGCSSMEGGTTPEETVRQYFNALNQGSIDDVRELTHDDRADPPTNKDIAEWGALSVNLTNIELQEESDDTAMVEVLYAAETSAGAQAYAERIELRKQGGEWRIYSAERIDEEE